MSRQTGTSRATVTRVLRSGTISSVAAMVLSLTVIPFVLSGASLGTYGAWATLGGLLALARLSEGGIPTEVARRVAAAEGRGDVEGARKTVQQALTLMIAVGLGLLVAGALVAVFGLPVLFDDVSRSELTTLRVVFLCTLSLLAVSLLLATWFATLGGLQRQDFGAYSAVAGALGAAVTTVVLIHFGFGIWSLFLASVVQSLIGWLGPLRGMRRVRPDISFRPARVTRSEASSLLRASSFLLLGGLAQIADRQVDKFVLTRVNGSDAAGVFQIGVSLSSQPALVAALPSGLLLAGAAELVLREPARLDRLRALSEKAAFSLGFLVAGGIIVFAPSFVHLWLGPSYEAVARVSQILAAASVPVVVATPWYFYAIGRGWQSVVVTSAVLSLIVNGIGSITLTPTFGAEGAAFASLAAAAVACAATYVLLRRRDPTMRAVRALMPFGVIATLVVGSVLVLPPFHSWISLIVAGVLWVMLAGSVLVMTRSLPARVTLDQRRPRILLDR